MRRSDVKVGQVYQIRPSGRKYGRTMYVRVVGEAVQARVPAYYGDKDSYVFRVEHPDGRPLTGSEAHALYEDVGQRTLKSIYVPLKHGDEEHPGFVFVESRQIVATKEDAEAAVQEARERDARRQRAHRQMIDDRKATLAEYPVIAEALPSEAAMLGDGMLHVRVSLSQLVHLVKVATEKQGAIR